MKNFSHRKLKLTDALKLGPTEFDSSNLSSSFSPLFLWLLWEDKGDELEELITGASEEEEQAQTQEITNPSNLAPRGKHSSNAYDFMCDQLVHACISKWRQSREAETVTADKQCTTLYYQLLNCAPTSRLPERALNTSLSKDEISSKMDSKRRYLPMSMDWTSCVIVRNFSKTTMFQMHE